MLGPAPSDLGHAPIINPITLALRIAIPKARPTETS